MKPAGEYIAAEEDEDSQKVDLLSTVQMLGQTTASIWDCSWTVNLAMQKQICHAYHGATAFFCSSAPAGCDEFATLLA